MSFSVFLEGLTAKRHTSKVVFSTPLVLYVTLYLKLTIIIFVGSVCFVWSRPDLLGLEAFSVDRRCEPRSPHPHHLCLLYDDGGLLCGLACLTVVAVELSSVLKSGVRVLHDAPLGIWSDNTLPALD